MARDLSRETAERLLSGASTSPPAQGDPLVALLAAAAAPGRAHELAGERDALAAFHALPAPQHRFSLRRAIAVKIAAVVAVTATAGGIAMASSAGILPNPFKPPTTAPASTSPPPSSPGSIKPSPSVAPPMPPAAQVPVSSLPGLCHALAAKPSGERGKALESPAFSALLDAAGKPQDVAGFCARLLASPEPKPRPTDPPGKSHKPPQSHRTPTR